jgi:hypothetical protein
LFPPNGKAVRTRADTTKTPGAFRGTDVFESGLL